MLRLKLSFLAVVLSTAGVASSRVPPAELQGCVAAAAERQGLSGTILISRGDAVVTRVDRGMQSGPESPAIGSRTRFNLGSASKMFTAVAIGQLIDAGRLRLDQPVGEIVQGLTPQASRVTIRQLLTHSSGLGDFFKPENMEAMLRARSASDVLPLIARDVPAFPPGSRFAYSNSGFALLGVVIERLTGMTYGDYLARHVFRAAGMTSTGLDPRPSATLAVGMTNGGMHGPPGSGAPRMLIGPDGKPMSAGSTPPSVGAGGLRLIGPDGHQLDPATGPPGTLFPAPGAKEGYGSAAGGIFSTADDMGRFATALMTHRLLSPATSATFMAPQIEAAAATPAGPARYYGFGFGMSEFRGKRWIGHNGGTLGANAEFSMEPQDRWVISVLSNRDPPIATNLMREIRELMADPGRTANCASS